MCFWDEIHKNKGFRGLTASIKLCFRRHSNWMCTWYSNWTFYCFCHVTQIYTQIMHQQFVTLFICHLQRTLIQCYFLMYDKKRFFSGIKLVYHLSLKKLYPYIFSLLCPLVILKTSLHAKTDGYLLAKSVMTEYKIFHQSVSLDQPTKSNFESNQPFLEWQSVSLWKAVNRHDHIKIF